MVDLSYLNARIKAWSAELLKREFYDELVSARDAKGLITHLKETQYAMDLEIAKARYDDDISILEAGLKGNLINTFKRLYNYAPPEAMILLRAVFSVWEAYNLKTILRAREKGISSDESITALIPAGEMDEAALKELNQQKSVKDVVDLLSTWGSPYAKPLKEAMKQYLQEKRFMVIELALDRFIYNYFLSVAKEGMHFDQINKVIVERFIKQRIDSGNISTLLKLSGEGVITQNAGEYFLDGGEIIDRDSFLRLAASRDRDSLLYGVADSVRDRHWRTAIRSIDPDEIFFLDERIEELIRGSICRLALLEPLSIALAICFIYKKIREIKNLRLILRQKVFEIPAMEIKRFLISG